MTLESRIRSFGAARPALLRRVVTPKTPIPGMGAYARVADSEGNIVGLFQNA